MSLLEIDYTQAPTVSEALLSSASIIGLMGPIGSGKSVGCVGWILMNAMHWQEPVGVTEDHPGVRKTRFAVIRNTNPELKSTSIKTFKDILPEGAHGRVVYSSPITYHIQIPANPEANEPAVDCEILFIGLDKPSDVGKLLSLELTGAWVNEAREVPWAIIDALTGRVGRYPSMREGGPTRPGIIMDTNPPDIDSWWYEKFEEGQGPVRVRMPDGTYMRISWELFKQPPAMLELDQISENLFKPKDEGYEDWQYEAEEVLPSAGSFYGINPEAENLKFLRPGYYHGYVLNKDQDTINVYARGKYGYVQEGKPVMPEFNAHTMVREFPILEDRPLLVGMDIGGGTLQPAAIIGQLDIAGRWYIHSELIGESIGVDNFLVALKLHIAELYPPGIKIKLITIDPAAEGRDEILETQVRKFIQAQMGVKTQLAPSNDWKTRRRAAAGPMSRLVLGEPGMLIHPRCRKLISGLKGKWEFKKMAVSGSPVYQDKPSKNEYSHPCEALGYLVYGTERNPGGMTERSEAATQKARGGFKAQSFDVFD